MKPYYSATFLALKKLNNGKADVLFDFSGQTFWCEICGCKTSQSFRVGMDSWIKWLSLLSSLKIDIAIMAETKTTDKWNSPSLFLTCVRVSRQGDCLHTKLHFSERIFPNSNFFPPKVFSEESQIYFELSEIFGSFLRLLLVVAMQILGWVTGVTP